MWQNSKTQVKLAAKSNPISPYWCFTSKLYKLFKFSIKKNGGRMQHIFAHIKKKNSNGLTVKQSVNSSAPLLEPSGPPGLKWGGLETNILNWQN